ncbi:MAG: helix-turn-helix domain-containing protein [Phycisphaerales bacterium]|jgi:excisionase family DNA binding protein|nr:helix-turn-helix domain-containing protein [Phycisphaerales bacterium]
MTNKTNDNVSADKLVFTTGEAAKICNVSQQTIIRCFDSGRLHGFKVPGSRFRRIPRSELIRFMQHNNMDMNRMDVGAVQVLVVGLTAPEVDSLIKTHSEGHNIQIHHAKDAWTAGFLGHQCNPSLILLSSKIGGITKESILATLTSDDGEEKTVVVIVDNNNNNGLNVPNNKVDSSEVIKKAVRKLISA